ncbi:uncharacterized protein LOC122063209 isoform X2 [Macadamia integrifolia]|uniref:uncharacterized protein LOC122063209 isoform X2 n=1 Tax=Macadamia integrifolia TaxID=60698 RepID=UPI001C4E7C06|nr:uncharacterized protein LOC122063209 isoform X2 [Macadamia integrifolia]
MVLLVACLCICSDGMSQHYLPSSISATFIFLASDEDEEDEDGSFQEALLEKTQAKSGSSNRDSHRKCCPFHTIHVGSRQKFVILVSVLVFFFMMAFAVLIWIGRGKNRIDSSVVARVYIDIFSVAMLLLGGALACYGLVLFLKMRKVRSDKALSEMWKVAGLAVVSVVCFTSSAVVALFSDIPVLYHWHPKSIKDVKTPVLIILYYFIGSSIPSAFVLWVMKEMPPPHTVGRQAQSRIVTFIRDRPATMHHPQRWTTITSAQNQGKRTLPCRHRYMPVRRPMRGRMGASSAWLRGGSSLSAPGMFRHRHASRHQELALYKKKSHEAEISRTLKFMETRVEVQDHHCYKGLTFNHETERPLKLLASS